MRKVRQYKVTAVPAIAGVAIMVAAVVCGGALYRRTLEAEAYSYVCRRFSEWGFDAAAVGRPHVRYAWRVLADDPPGYTVFGQCDRATGDITLMSPIRFVGEVRRAWGVRFSWRLLQSVMVHELTHSVLCRLTPDMPTAIHEYLAFALQYGALPEAARQVLLQQHPGTELLSCVDITLDNYLGLGRSFGPAAHRLHSSVPQLAPILVADDTEGLGDLFPRYRYERYRAGIAAQEW